MIQNIGFNLDNITPKLNDNLINNKNNTIKEGFTDNSSCRVLVIFKENFNF